MRKNKLFATALLLGSAISCCACGSSKSNDTSSTTPPIQTTTAPETTKASEAKPLSIGKFSNDGIYTNEAFDLQFDPNPLQLIMASDEQLSQMSGISIENSLTLENAQKVIDEGKFYMDMAAYSSDGNSTVNVGIQNMEKVYGSTTNIDHAIEESMNSMKKQLESSGMTNVEISKTTATFKGKETPALRISAEANHRKVYETQVFVMDGNYMATITATMVNENHEQTLLDAFLSINK